MNGFLLCVSLLSGFCQIKEDLNRFDTVRMMDFVMVFNDKIEALSVIFVTL